MQFPVSDDVRFADQVEALRSKFALSYCFGDVNASVLDRAAKAIADAVGAHVVLISSVHSGVRLVRTHGVYDHQSRFTSHAYLLAGTPCACVVDTQRVIAFPRELQQMFPDDLDLQKLQLDAYVGAPLLNSSGESAGLCCALWQGELADTRALEVLFAQIAPHLSRELGIAEEIQFAELSDAGGRSGHWHIDLEVGEVALSPRAGEILGIEALRARSTQETLFPWMCADDNARAAALFEACSLDGRDFELISTCCSSADDQRHFRVTGAIARDAQGRPTRFAGDVTDVTELVEAREEALRFAKDLETERASLEARVVERTLSLQAAKSTAETANAAKSQFLAAMSHELRTPLNAIIGYTEMMVEEATEQSRDDDIQDHRRVLRAATSLLALINDILDLAKVEAGKQVLKCEAFDVSELVEEALETVVPMARARGIELINEASGLGLFMGDPLKTRQCLVNLLSNAVKFTPVGSVTLRGTRDGVSLRFDVIDTGIGIASDRLDAIFSPYVQVDSTTTRECGGTGLGLALSRKLANLMGGDVSVDSVIGRGSCFTLTLREPEQHVRSVA